MDMVRKSYCRRFTESIKAIFFAFTVSLLAMCNKDTPKYGVAYNIVRDSIGLTKISSGFHLVKHTGFIEVWENSACIRDNKQGCFFKKKIRFNDTVLLNESDIYLGPGEYKTIDGTFNEKLFWVYTLSIDRKKYQWQYTIQDKNSISDGYLGKKITKKEAKAILKKWNIIHTQ